MSRPKRNAAVEANNILFRLNKISSSDDSSDNSDDEEDAIISDDNYDDKEQDSNHENQILDQNIISKNGEKIWSASPVIIAAQPRAHNIIRQPTGPTRLAAQTY